MSKLRERNLKSVVEDYSKNHPNRKEGINTIAVFYKKGNTTVNVFKKWLDEYIKTGDLPKIINKITGGLDKTFRRNVRKRGRDYERLDKQMDEGDTTVKKVVSKKLAKEAQRYRSAKVITKAVRKFASKTVIRRVGGETALDANVKTIQLKIEKVGNADVSMLAARTFWLARRQLPKEFKHYRIVAYIETIKSNGERGQLKTHSYESTPTELNDFLDELIEKLEGKEEYHTHDLQGAIVEFSVVNIPTGGTTRVEIVNHEDVLRRQSVLRIKNPNDNNCFWYAIA